MGEIPKGKSDILADGTKGHSYTIGVLTLDNELDSFGWIENQFELDTCMMKEGFSVYEERFAFPNLTRHSNSNNNSTT